VYDVEVKSHLLDYAQSAMYFADRCESIVGLGTGVDILGLGD